ncbi:MAG: amidohydrolase family protein [Candidatus Thorarchaeota archaeon SMTZ1-45]
MKPDLLLTNIGQVATLAGNSDMPKTGTQMGEVSIIENGAIAVKEGKIIAVGPTKQILSQVTEEPKLPAIEFPGMLATPGFIDSHTHLTFGGSRENDFAMKLAGKSYLEILEAGGGILSTLRFTRTASEKELISNAFSYAESMLSMGSTMIEAKSGYGLDTENELKMLKAVDGLREKLPISLVSTFMGAHAVPPEYEGNTEAYVDLVIDEMIPAVVESGLAEFCDVFCEKGVFDIEQSRRILLEAKDKGLKLEAMLKAGTIATLLPATAFSLNTEYADARKMIEMGLPVALATDFNPNCANESLFFTIALSCYKMKMNPREALSAVTINAAHGLDRGATHGSIEVGKAADILILDCPNPEYLTWRFGVNLVHTVISNGQVIHTKLGP